MRNPPLLFMDEGGSAAISGWRARRPRSARRRR